MRHKFTFGILFRQRSDACAELCDIGTLVSSGLDSKHDAQEIADMLNMSRQRDDSGRFNGTFVVIPEVATSVKLPD